jgi:hypothetical protein
LRRPWQDEKLLERLGERIEGSELNGIKLGGKLD